jgi:hypothetical protein
MVNIKYQVFFVLCATVAISNMSYASQIECDIRVSDSQNQLIIKPNDDVYAFSKIDLPGGFRVSGQFLTMLNRFKLYVYDSSKERYALLTSQEFALSPETCARQFGESLSYGAPYERELFVKCRQVCSD